MSVWRTGGEEWEIVDRLDADVTFEANSCADNAMQRMNML